VLVRGSRDPKEWIFFKIRDPYATVEGDVVEDRPESILSGNLVEEVGEPSKKKPQKAPVTGSHPSKANLNVSA
jgi:hypothetical protein